MEHFNKTLEIGQASVVAAQKLAAGLKTFGASIKHFFGSCNSRKTLQAAQEIFVSNICGANETFNL